MKRFIHASTLFVGSLLSAGLLAAGSFNVPFDFEASGKTLPSGQYTVARMSLTSNVFRLQNRDSGKQVLISMPVQVQDRGNEKPRMVFRCNGGDCSVAEIWPTEGVGVARMAKRSQAKPVAVDATN